MGEAETGAESVMAGNRRLNRAKARKSDEFFTKFSDIEREMRAYLDFDPDAFRGKTVLLPCDDPDESEFARYFTENFEKLGLSRLICSCFSHPRGKLLVLGKGLSYGGHLSGNGDFRSAELAGLRDEADMIITNPPFSLFREFIAWVAAGGKKFSVLGNLNAAICRDVFPLIRNGRMWLGATIHSGDREFRVPDDYPLEAASWRIEGGMKYIRVNGVLWFTNIGHAGRFRDFGRLTMEANLARHPGLIGSAYRKYDNHEAIEIPKTEMIPAGFGGIMGVPISFLDKFNPDLFEILGMDFDVRDGALRHLARAGWEGKLDRAYLGGKRLYSRMLIRERKDARRKNQEIPVRSG